MYKDPCYRLLSWHIGRSSVSLLHTYTQLNINFRIIRVTCHLKCHELRICLIFFYIYHILKLRFERILNVLFYKSKYLLVKYIKVKLEGSVFTIDFLNFQLRLLAEFGPIFIHFNLYFLFCVVYWYIFLIT